MRHPRRRLLRVGPRRRSRGSRTPSVRRVDGEMLALAGIWAPIHGEGLTAAILTTTPNELVAPIHNRMPVILDRAALDAWLDPRSEPASCRRCSARPDRHAAHVAGQHRRQQGRHRRTRAPAADRAGAEPRAGLREWRSPRRAALSAHERAGAARSFWPLRRSAALTPHASIGAARLTHAVRRSAARPERERRFRRSSTLWVN